MLALVHSPVSANWRHSAATRKNPESSHPPTGVKLSCRAYYDYFHSSTRDSAMDRRTFVEVIAGRLLAVPRVAHAQSQTKVFRIGILSSASVTSPEAGHIWAAFFQGLRELGY